MHVVALQIINIEGKLGIFTWLEASNYKTLNDRRCPLFIILGESIDLSLSDRVESRVRPNHHPAAFVDIHEPRRVCICILSQLSRNYIIDTEFIRVEDHVIAL